jgi:four helix bundle protein
MGTIKRFEQIQAWQKARELVREVYRVCESGPLKRDWGLRDQLCRAAVSSMSNVAEGLARNTDKDFAHFLDMAKGSAVEAQSLLYAALDVGYLDDAAFQKLFRLADETVALIGGFSSYLRRQSKPRTPD